jgi:hypothetical protein
MREQQHGDGGVYGRKLKSALRKHRTGMICLCSFNIINYNEKKVQLGTDNKIDERKKYIQ